MFFDIFLLFQTLNEMVTDIFLLFQTLNEMVTDIFLGGILSHDLRERYYKEEGELTLEKMLYCVRSKFKSDVIPSGKFHYTLPRRGQSIKMNGRSEEPIENYEVGQPFIYHYAFLH